MNLSFVPGGLNLTKTQHGNYVLTIQGEEIFTTRHEKKAIAKFNELRKEMESQYPARELTTEEKKAILRRMIMHQMMGEVKRDMASPVKKKNKTKTFG
jgi:uncharacterized protein YnzC (UPF0291/DUF896 family)